MTIIRISKRETPYVLMDKTFLEDNRLSFKAKGILAYLLSKPDNWVIMLKDLAAKGQEGRCACASAIHELESAGYVERKKTKSEKGHFEGWETIVYEQPKSGYPTSDNLSPKSGFPKSDNLTLINNEFNNINANAFIECRFEEFWAPYPIKVKRKEAEELWKKKKLDRIADTIINNVKLRVEKDAQWKAGYIPHAPKFIKGHQWEDEIQERNYVSRSNEKLIESIPERAKRQRLALRASQAAAAAALERISRKDN
jgi:hypothetical protein